MKNSFPRAIHLRDYSAPGWWIDEVELDVSIADDGVVIVQTGMLVRRNENAVRGALQLDGEALELMDVNLGGVSVPAPFGMASWRSMTCRIAVASRPRYASGRISTPRCRVSSVRGTVTSRSAKPKVFAASPGFRTGRT